MDNKKDKLVSEKGGLFIGILIPLFATFIYYLYLSPGSIQLFLKQTFLYGIHTRVIGLFIIPNFVLYFYFRWKSKLRVAEGISIASLIYLLLIVILKYAT